MSPRQTPFRWLTLVPPAAVLIACGGDPASPGAPAPTAPTTLSVSAGALALAMTGTPRLLTVTNTGTQSALNVAATVSQALPVGTTVVSTCGTLAPGASCTITVTPGAVPSAAPGDLNPTPARLAIAGSNTNNLSVDVQVIGQGSVHQGGYVFAIDDSTPNTGSIGGKVAGLGDVSATAPWSADAGGVALAVDVVGAGSLTDGSANTSAIVAAVPAGVAFHAAGLCAGSSAQGYSDWYLPAICELQGAGGICPVASNNVQSLVNSGIGGLAGIYWSSTQLSPSAAFAQDTVSGTAFTVNKITLLPVRCARPLTP
ncbi:hypothetical protein [Hydrogenophaga sp. T2]|uniref:hypothetical protein n=1 Tax=Hydrogenophaga sp. T2 TaxID=3132823 RepID=UPI003CF12CE4